MIEQVEMKKNNPPFKKKWKNIYFLNGCALVISCGLIATTLFIAWIFFVSVYRSNINELLTIISNNVFNFNFVGLTLSMYVFIIIYIYFLILLFMFLKKHNVITISIVGTCIGVSVVLLTFMIIFGVIAYDDRLQTSITNKSVNNGLFFIIPYTFTIIFIIAAMGFACWIIFNFFPKKRKVIKAENSEFNIDIYNITNNNYHSGSFMNMENNEDLLEASKSLPVSDQPFISSKKHLIDKKNDDKPDLEKLEKIRLQVDPGAVPAVLQKTVNSENIEPKIQKKIDEYHIKPKFNTQPNATKNKEKIINKLPSNKKVNTNEIKTQLVLTGKISQPLQEDKEKAIYVRDVTQNTHQNPTITKNEENTRASTNNNSLEFTKQPELIKSNDNLNLKTFNINSADITIQEENSKQFIQNDYPIKAPIQGVPPKPNTFNIPGTPYVLTEQISQPLNPAPPEPAPEPKPLVAPLKVWKKEQINKAWERGLIVPTYNPEIYRSDYAGALIFKESFVANPEIKENNNVRSYSWTIVYQRPLLANGTEESSNLWPLNCNNALAKGDNYPKWKTNVTFNGYENVHKEKKWKGKRK